MRLACSFALVLLCGVAHAADAQSEALLKKMRTAYQGVKTARITTASNVDLGGNRVTLTIKTAFSAPNVLRTNVSGIPGRSDDPIVIVSNGKRITRTGLQASGNDKPYSPQVLVEMLLANLETLCFWDWKRQLSTDQGANMHGSQLKVSKANWNGKTWTLLEETVPNRAYVRYYIDPATSLIWRTEYFAGDKKRLIMDCQIKSLELNPKLAPSELRAPGMVAV